MDANEIVPLTPASVEHLVKAHASAEESGAESGQRRASRWPFPGTIQFWLTDKSGAERLVFGTCCDLSTTGLGARTDELLPAGSIVSIAIHLPQASYHGKATIRHCTKGKTGYYAGVAFDFA